MKSKSVSMLLVIGSLSGAGTSRYIIKLLNSLRYSTFMPAVLVCANEPGILWGDVEKLGYKPVFIPLGVGWKGRFKFLYSLGRYLYTNRPQLVHAMSGMVGVYTVALARLFGVKKVIMSQRNMVYWLDESPNKFWRHLLYRLILPVACDRILVNAAAIRDQLINIGFPASRISIIFNGIDVPLDNQIDQWRREARKAFGVSDGTVVIGIVGYLRKVKRMDRFLRLAQKIISLSTPEKISKFIIIGDGPERIELEILAKKLGVNDKVIFLGQKTNAYALEAGFDIGILTSSSEGFPQVIIEYLSLGLPIVATQVGGISEVIQQGETGFLCEQDDLETMAVYVQKLISSDEERKRMGLNSKHDSIDRFSLKREISEHYNIYNNLIDTL